MIYWINKLGIMGYPLIITSIVVLAIIIEKAFFFFKIRLNTVIDYQHIQTALLEKKTPSDCPHLKKKYLYTAINLLFRYQDKPKSIRDDMLSHWLIMEKPFYYKRLKSLHLLAVLSPMMGLLGTVLGLITAFQSLAETQQNLTSTLLANGLWNAMLTTAYGLIIALPALFFSHIYKFWADQHLEKLTSILNMLSFSVEGIKIDPK